ncbi:hypothetical protein [Sphingobium sp. WCS2017Hpa-17]|uniref:hypothetical protein n=1 Tax=Sphingobium sp. WCS2017Hpa-17 TaxID=3073638 RepID=UPI00288B9B41|nr:hypothetical protein [Sphingobium sp. WCS2017Hpa-17]
MVRLTMAVCLVLAPAAVGAQDIAPVISPGQVAEGLYYRSRMEAQAKATRNRQSGAGASATRARPPLTRDRQQQICASRPFFREKMGADDPQVLKLDSLCTKAGF